MSTYAEIASAMHGPRIFCRGCHDDVMARSERGYCRDCQAIYDECKVDREARILRNRLPTPRVPGDLLSWRREKRVGIGSGYSDDYYGFTDVDWQDALHPNEGDL